MQNLPSGPSPCPSVHDQGTDDGSDGVRADSHSGDYSDPADIQIDKDDTIYLYNRVCQLQWSSCMITDLVP